MRLAIIKTNHYGVHEVQGGAIAEEPRAIFDHLYDALWSVDRGVVVPSHDLDLPGLVCVVEEQHPTFRKCVCT